MLRRAAAIVVPSRAHLALSADLRGFEAKAEVIPFGIDERRWDVVPPPAPGQPPRAIFIGRLVAYKGVDILLRALERVPDLRLDIVGAGPEVAAAQDAHARASPSATACAGSASIRTRTCRAAWRTPTSWCCRR